MCWSPIWSIKIFHKFPDSVHLSPHTFNLAIILCFLSISSVSKPQVKYFSNRIFSSKRNSFQLFRETNISP